ncbi:uncharacterized protein B0I36DRAFT_321081 [Microdochium trichocladiopsis]|uniref:Zn(2)-C6 fungal-type domain-containing protein n=1 Tax=Microdochium trichocladiopsis TaxID=1682393 RepID=A0A9P9BRX3_9PEZI|nr:uncharacterized protein B0I36DRAFT_321081 [Microdochium trichocladiopsis]KAH7033265.1 hypothetical protein B0I36DRAFT_321081 [Microdochium trichocladiopsis]
MGIYLHSSGSQASASHDTPSPEHMGTYVPTHAAKASEDRLWASRAPVSPPMTNYAPSTRTDMSSRTNEPYLKPRDDSTAAAIQRLPSLNSLFGRPPSQIRPLHAPLLERPSPLAGPSRSPLDHQPSTTSSQRSLSTSYFPSTVTPRSNYAASNRSDGDRHTTGLLHFPGPLSPGRGRDSISSQHDSRHDSLSTGRWSYSSQSEARRPDYVLSTSEAPTFYRTSSDRLPFPGPSSRVNFESGATNFREQTIAHQPPPPSERPQASLEVGGPAASEGLPVKDGLGPKIWTGTHFLPRFLRQSEVPGEGLCYFYDDGTHCKAIIDGEQVNAHWGVTKAGKPRKRLAIACLTCREKKIKCDPDFPRCVQCEKFGRVCRFKNAPRGGHNTSPGTSPAREAEEMRAPAPPSSQLDVARRRRSVSLESVSPKTSSLKRVASSAELGETQPAKRVVLEYERYAQPAGEHMSPLSKTRELPRPTAPWPEQVRGETRVETSQELPRLPDDILRRRPW